VDRYGSSHVDRYGSSRKRKNYIMANKTLD
jgi:hypothetical protein